MPQAVAIVADEKNAWKTGPPLPDGWQDTLVDYLERRGTYAKACKAAGVSDETARRYRHADPAFDERCRWAREIHADSLEEKLEDEATATGNPVGHIVRLKAIRPAQYIEKHAVLSLTANLNELPGIDAAVILRRMLGDASAATLQQLGPAVAPETTG